MAGDENWDHNIEHAPGDLVHRIGDGEAAQRRLSGDDLNAFHCCMNEICLDANPGRSGTKDRQMAAAA